MTLILMRVGRIRCPDCRITHQQLVDERQEGCLDPGGAEFAQPALDEAVQ